MKKDRIIAIDILRACSIIGVIAIHTLSYQLRPDTEWVWNYLHFVEGIFVFSSGYVLFAKYDRFANLRNALYWILKRVKRLLIPYYIFFLLHYALFSMFPSYFNGFGLAPGAPFFWKSLFLIGGYNPNWLPVLFLELSLLFPLLLFFISKKLLFVGYVFFAIFCTVFFTLFSFPYDAFRYVMWAPWSLVFLLAYIVTKLKQKYATLIGAGVSGLVFLLLFMLFTILHRSTVLIQNKYPPNLFYIAYEVFGILIAFFFIFWVSKYIPTFFNKKIQFISSNSYQIYFVHAIVLDFLANVLRQNHIQPSMTLLFCAVLIVSVLISYIFSIIRIGRYLS